MVLPNGHSINSLMGERISCGLWRTWSWWFSERVPLCSLDYVGQRSTFSLRLIKCFICPCLYHLRKLRSKWKSIFSRESAHCIRNPITYKWSKKCNQSITCSKVKSSLLLLSILPQGRSIQRIKIPLLVLVDVAVFQSAGLGGCSCLSVCWSWWM